MCFSWIKAFDAVLQEKLSSRFKMCLVDELAEGQGLKGHRTLRAQSRASPVFNVFITHLDVGVECTIRKLDTNSNQSGRGCLGQDALQRPLCS